MARFVTPVISDIKVTSVYSFLLGEKPEWINQLNVYAWCYGKIGFNVSALRIDAILRDWMRSKTLRDPDYPPIPFMTVDIPIWDWPDAEQYIHDRVALHLEAERTMTAPVCTDEERWGKPTTYAVIKKGNKRAARVLDSMEAAQDWADFNIGGKYEIQERPGSYTKCESYCLVRGICEHNPYKAAA
jgi:hypothetical protein